MRAFQPKIAMSQWPALGGHWNEIFVLQEFARYRFGTSHQFLGGP